METLILLFFSFTGSKYPLILTAISLSVFLYLAVNEFEKSRRNRHDMSSQGLGGRTLTDPNQSHSSKTIYERPSIRQLALTSVDRSIGTKHNLLAIDRRLVNNAIVGRGVSLRMINKKQEKKWNHFLCTVFIGGIGNQMFQFASVYGIAASKNMSVILSSRDLLARVFHLSAEIRNNRSICQHMETRYEKKHCAHDNELRSFKGDTDYRIILYLQSWKYFNDVESDIRKQFKFRSDILRKAMELKTSILVKYRNITANLTTIGIHIRRGDIVTNQRLVDYGFQAAPREYLHKAMQYFYEHFPAVIFIVCSNDMHWSRRNTLSIYNIEFIEGNSPEVDMSVLSLCDHTIMTVGTFGWWSAWLAGGQTIYYKHPAKENSKLRQQFNNDYSDYFYPKWIGMH